MTFEQTVEKEIEKILQDCIAGEVWYQDRGCELSLKRGLSKAKKKLIIFASTLHSQLLKDVRESMIPAKEIGGGTVIPFGFESKKEQVAWMDGHKTAGRQVANTIDSILDEFEKGKG